jgi:hypothetical protein
MIANNKNTALIVEPRDDVNVVHLINDFQNKLGDDWIIVFYCGQNLKTKMTEMLTTANVEVRELSVSNFNSLNEYSDFMKRKDVWQSLYGNFVLTFQFDTYIINESPHTIEHFINMNKSYIGGNMDHEWLELIREKMFIANRNFNGGLSLRKRVDMIKIINVFGTEQTVSQSTKIQTDAEDVYFTLGCYMLDLPIGDDEECMHFCVNRILVNGYFGVHKPIPALLHNCEKISKLYCNETNKFIINH